MNPMSQNNNQLAMIKNLYAMCKGTTNPIQLLEQMSASNSQLKPFVSLLRQGLTPEQVFMQACNSKGINGQDFISQLNNIVGNK